MEVLDGTETPSIPDTTRFRNMLSLYSKLQQFSELQSYSTEGWGNVIRVH
jgi:hypothetical protein